MAALAESARFIHVLFGAIGLAAFWIPIFARKGAVNHVRFGKVFVWSAYVVLSAAAIALASRFVSLAQNGIGPTEAPVQFAFLVFLAYLTFVTYVTLRQGMAVLRHKRHPTLLATNFNRVLALAAIAASVGLIVYAIVLAPPNRILLFALSPIGLGVGFGNIKYMGGTHASQRAWLYEHLGAMIGAGIAFHTAFAVFGATRLFDIGLSGWVAVIPWILPAALGIPAISIWTNYYRRKYREIT